MTPATLGLWAAYRRYLGGAALSSLGVNVLVLAPSIYALVLFDRVLTSRSEETLVVLTLGTVGALAALFAFDHLRSRLLASLGLAVDRSLGPTVIRAVLAQAALRTEEDAAQALRDLATMRAFLMGSGVLALFDAPWLPLYLLLVGLFHPLLGAIATLGAALLLAATYGGERLTKPGILRGAAETRRAARFLDAGVRNAEVVAALGMHEQFAGRWAEVNDKALATQADYSRRLTWLAASGRCLRQALQLAMLAAGAWLAIGDNVAPGIMVAATILLGRALQPLETVLAGWRSLVESRAALGRLAAFLAGLDARPEPMPLAAPQGDLLADRLVFALQPQRPAILKGISFALKAGEALAIIGPSGAGKSTLARLLVGLWRPTAGSVRLDGADIGGWSRAALGPHIGYLPQDVELFAATVAANIGRLGPVDAEAVAAAAARAHAHRFILGLPKGYDTELGEDGSPLSPGQRQRIALARAVYGRPSLLVLDEPSANLDADGENALLATMAALKTQGVTQVLITHRPALLAVADRVLVLREGMVEAYGPAADILSRVTRSAAPAGHLKVIEGSHHGD